MAHPGGSGQVDPGTSDVESKGVGAEGNENEKAGEDTVPDAGMPSAPARLARPAAVLLAVAAAVVAVAAVLPWSELSSGDETRTLTGLAVGDGRLTGLLSVVLAWVGCAAAVGRRAFAADVVVARLAAVGVVAVSAFDVAFGPPTLSSVRGISADRIAVGAEVGVVSSLAAGLLALLAAMLLRRR